MANRIKGITIEIDGNTTKLSDALSKLDKNLKQTGSELRDVNRLLKLDPTNVNLLRQKQELLADSIKNTKEREKELEQALEQAQQAGDTEENRHQQDLLQRELVETRGKLKDLEKQARDCASVMGVQMQAVGEKLQETGKKLSAVGAKMTTSLTLPITAGFAASFKAAEDWETAFTGVMKTVEETSTTSYEEIEEGLKDLARATASTKTDIAGVAEAAGQLGISADNVVDFTETMVKLGDTTNLTAEEAATSLARIMNITGDSADSVDRLGSVIVELGNNSATSEAEIVDMANRLAAAGKLAGLTTPEIFALSASMSSVGIEAAAGGTAMTQTLNEIETQVALFAIVAESNLDLIAEIAHMSAEDFAQSWEERPIEALTAFIAGLGDLDEAGESATLILSELEMDGIRQENMLKSLSLASDMLTGSVDMANAAYEENTALNEEAAKRYSTTEAKISQAKEAVSELGIEIGEALIPHVLKMIEKLESAVDWFTNLDEGTQEAILTAAAFVAAIGPVISIIGGVVTAVGTLISWGGMLMTNWAAVGGAAGILGAAIEFITGPIGITIAAITALIGAGVWLYQNWDTCVEKCQHFEEVVQTKFENIRSTVAGKIDAARQAVHDGIEKIKSLFNFSWELPKLKMPHFSWSGKFSLNPPSAPSFKIDWWDKAAQSGVIFNARTIFGQNGRGQLMGAGETYSETLVGTQSLLGMVRSTVNSAISKASSQQNTFNIYAAAGQNTKDIAREVEKILVRQEKERKAAYGY